MFIGTKKYFYFILINLILNVNCIKWNYKYSLTSVNQQQLTIDCPNNDQIWIGWSHYGTRIQQQQQSDTSILQQKQQTDLQLNDFTSINMILNENDCWMNFTEKIAEQCNGANECDISSQPTYIHKCGKISDYIFVSYVCYKAENTYDICKNIKIENELLNNHLLITSPDFPNEYPPSVDCTCLINSNNNFKFDTLWFSLQDNDYLNINNKNLSAWLNPTNELTILNKSATLRFKTDDALAYKGFWLKVLGTKSCKDDWQLVGDNCIKIFSESLDWRSANQKCQTMNGYLVKIDDVINDLKLTHYMKTYYPEISSYWIGLRKYVDETNTEKWMWSDTNSTSYNDISWWPWRRISDNKQQINQNCIIKRKNEDGYFTVSCDSTNRNSYICQTDNSYEVTNTKISLECGETDVINKQIAQNSIVTASQPAVITTATKQKPQINLAIDSLINNPIDFNKFLTTLKIDKKIQQQQEPTTTKEKISILLPIDDQHIFDTEIGSDNTEQQLFTSILKSKLIESASSSSSSTNKIETKYSSTVIAGIISGIGLVILIVNVLVLVICRRNLKKLIKNAKQQTQQPQQQQQTQNDDLTQDYFESFAQTLPNSLYNQQQQQQNQQVSTIKPFLMRKDGTDLIKNLTLKSTNQTISNNKQPQLNCLFQPIVNDIGEFIQPMQQQQVHQYDKMNHQLNKLLLRNDADSNAQPQHTYESVDTLELPYKRNIHLGVSSCNFKMNNSPKLNKNQNLLFNINTSHNSNDLCFNTTSTSSSTTSSASSTNQFIRQMSKHQPKQQQQQQQQQFIIHSNKTNHQQNGSWSPDSAYYSSIPNYGYNTLLDQQQQQRQAINFNFFNQNEHLLNDNLKSQFV